MIEAGTYMCAAAATTGPPALANRTPKHRDSISAQLEEMGLHIEEYDDSVYVTRSGPLNRVNVKTLPYPGFPTDMQPQMGALMCLAEGTSYLNETVIENRFKYTNELQKMELPSASSVIPRFSTAAPRCREPKSERLTFAPAPQW